jgi:hypothetical protein
MDESQVVRVLKRSADSAQDLHRPQERQLAGLGQQVLQGLSAKRLHDQEWLAIFILVELPDFGDIEVGEPRDHRRFVPESAVRLKLGRGRGGQKLHGAALLA